jgi:hypothetical protein
MLEASNLCFAEKLSLISIQVLQDMASRLVEVTNELVRCVFALFYYVVPFRCNLGLKAYEAL